MLGATNLFWDYTIPFIISQFAVQTAAQTPIGVRAPFKVKGGDPAALSSTATLLRLHPPH